MIEASTLTSILNMLQSKNNGVRNVAMYVLGRMMEHGMTGYACVSLS
jgi:hypothetical protein